MAVNADKVERWKADIAQSVDFYNDWFLRFAPKACRDTRAKTTRQVKSALERTANLTDISPVVLEADPSVLPMLRMSTAPPIARDRLIGLTRVSPNLVRSMEVNGAIPPTMQPGLVRAQLQKIGALIERLADRDIFVWLGRKQQPTSEEVYRAATIIADRLCGAMADPIIRNAQEQRQLATARRWLEERGYKLAKPDSGTSLRSMRAGTFAFRLNVAAVMGDTARKVNIPVDIVIKPASSAPNDLPLLVEAKSAGDFTNTNKRRKEEAAKVVQLRKSLGDDARYVLFLCGYFDSGYLGYEAAEGIDWVWEHRIDDFAQFGL